jgi:hypothetical protein
VATFNGNFSKLFIPFSGIIDQTSTQDLEQVANSCPKLELINLDGNIVSQSSIAKWMGIFDCEVIVLKHLCMINLCNFLHNHNIKLNTEINTHYL